MKNNKTIIKGFFFNPEGESMERHDIGFTADSLVAHSNGLDQVRRCIRVQLTKSEQSPKKYIILWINPQEQVPSDWTLLSPARLIGDKNVSEIWGILRE